MNGNISTDCDNYYPINDIPRGCRNIVMLLYNKTAEKGASMSTRDRLWVPRPESQ